MNSVNDGYSYKYLWSGQIETDSHNRTKLCLNDVMCGSIKTGRL